MTVRHLVQLQVLHTAAQSIVEQSEYYEIREDASLSKRWQSAVEKAIFGLLDFPERGSFCQLKSPDLKNLRRVAIPHFPKHLIFYRLDKAENTVVVIDILHGARDIEPLLAQSSQ